LTTHAQRYPRGALAEERDALAVQALVVEGDMASATARAAAFKRAVSELDGWRLHSLGAYFAYLEHPHRDRSGATVARELARERGVLCLPGAYFGPDQDRFLRVAFANVDIAAIRQIRERLAPTVETPARRHAAAR
jgi:aspartate/methionine/tyrosine aminotransferase